MQAVTHVLPSSSLRQTSYLVSVYEQLVELVPAPASSSTGMWWNSTSARPEAGKQLQEQEKQLDETFLKIMDNIAKATPEDAKAFGDMINRAFEDNNDKEDS